MLRSPIRLAYFPEELPLMNPCFVRGLDNCSDPRPGAMTEMWLDFAAKMRLNLSFVEADAFGDCVGSDTDANFSCYGLLGMVVRGEVDASLTAIFIDPKLLATGVRVSGPFLHLEPGFIFGKPALASKQRPFWLQLRNLLVFDAFVWAGLGLVALLLILSSKLSWLRGHSLSELFASLWLLFIGDPGGLFTTMCPALFAFLLAQTALKQTWSAYFTGEKLTALTRAPFRSMQELLPLVSSGEFRVASSWPNLTETILAPYPQLLTEVLKSLELYATADDLMRALCSSAGLVGTGDVSLASRFRRPFGLPCRLRLLRAETVAPIQGGFIFPPKGAGDADGLYRAFRAWADVLGDQERFEQRLFRHYLFQAFEKGSVERMFAAPEPLGLDLLRLPGMLFAAAALLACLMFLLELAIAGYAHVGFLIPFVGV